MMFRGWYEWCLWSFVVSYYDDGHVVNGPFEVRLENRLELFNGGIALRCDRFYIF